MWWVIGFVVAVLLVLWLLHGTAKDLDGYGDGPD